ncbi:DNA-binding transcriptional regulator, MerR family [Anaerocolumna jejuensis DSM 15929]|uniref:DNA-binding transcriptional regulator, MerR family n=1 Tax=Anaerocolumna jejuensis DSM 15929 TaxID=1121322 RepID=A0A1M6PRW0_9FIRM|nr:MerR family transcriptional regulator [Anaerocolumna jejuensis]SHK10622.1 DNA-binding transcriptional regulator, MerR family [Anaerocolumna jejuensis DSM 15929]
MTIAEASRKYELSQDTLRYYERIGLLPRVNRNKSGIRDYTEEDCGWIEFVKCMRNAGLPIEVLIEYVSLYQKGDSSLEARRELLVEQRTLLMAKMEEMKVTLERLNGKIDRYDQIYIPNQKKQKPKE